MTWILNMIVFVSHLRVSLGISANVSGLCVVALSKKLKLTTEFDRAITQNPCYVPLNLEL